MTITIIYAGNKKLKNYLYLAITCFSGWGSVGGLLRSFYGRAGGAGARANVNSAYNFPKTPPDGELRLKECLYREEIQFENDPALSS
jgi:hypothetical protein